MSEDSETAESGEAVRRGESDGKYELFAQVDNAIKEEIKDLVLNGTIVKTLLVVIRRVACNQPAD